MPGVYDSRRKELKMTSDEFVSDINVTPLVDVMLVLLVIFMVTAPIMTEGFDITLPKVDSSDILPNDTKHLVLSIKSDGSLFLNEYETVMEELPIALASYKDEEKMLFIRADKESEYGLVMNIMDHIRKSGVKNVSLITTSVANADGK